MIVSVHAYLLKEVPWKYQGGEGGVQKPNHSYEHDEAKLEFPDRWGV